MVAPKLRFKEFDEDWKLSTLSDISEIITGSTPSTSKSEYYDGNFLFVSPADIQENRYVEATKTTLTKEGFRKCRQIPNNSILFVCIGSTIGKIAQNKEICATNQQINAVVPNENHISDFLYLALDRIAPSIKLTAGIQAIPLINKTQFGKTTLSTPIFEEQTKIANFLSAVDEKIAQLSQKLHLLGQYKQGMMQKLFSQQIRFKADDGSDFWEWEETQLISISEIIMGSSPKSENYNENSIGLPLLQGNADIKNRKSAPRLYTSEITKTCDINDILLSVRAPVGFVAVSKHIACIGRGLCSIRAKNEYSQDFLYQWLLNHEKLWVSLSQGSTFDSVNSEQIKKLCILVPCLEEQTKIANFLSTIDKKMDVVSEQLKQTKTWKKGLLQQMFV